MTDRSQPDNILDIGEQALARDRDALEQLEQDTRQRIRRLETDIKGLISRDAEARATGRPAERAALVRIFSTLQLRRDKAQQFHAYLLSVRRLLDNVASAREYAALQQQVQHGLLGGMPLSRLRALLDACKAAELHNHTQINALNDDCARHDEDALLASMANDAEAEALLTAQSEAEYQALVQAQMAPMEAMADRVEQGLTRAAQADREPATTTAAPTPIRRSL